MYSASCSICSQGSAVSAVTSRCARLLSKGMSRQCDIGPFTVSALLASPVADALASNEIGPAEAGNQEKGPRTVWPPGGIVPLAASCTVAAGVHAPGQPRPLAGSAWKSFTDGSVADSVPRLRTRTYTKLGNPASGCSCEMPPSGKCRFQISAVAVKLGRYGMYPPLRPSSM